MIQSLLPGSQQNVSNHLTTDTGEVAVGGRNRKADTYGSL
jgi:hypothetical protein